MSAASVIPDPWRRYGWLSVFLVLMLVGTCQAVAEKQPAGDRIVEEDMIVSADRAPAADKADTGDKTDAGDQAPAEEKVKVRVVALEG